MTSRKTRGRKGGGRVQARLLAVLLDQGETYPGDMLRRDHELARRSIYTLLQRLEADGLVDSRQELKPADRAGLPRRFYKLTPRGEAEAKLVVELWRLRGGL